MVNLKKHIRHLLLSASLISLPLCAMADDKDFATDLGLGIEKGITKHWDVSLEEDLRLNNNDHNLDRWGSALSTSYEVLPKWLKVSAEYDFLADWNGYGKDYFTYRHRWSIGAGVKHNAFVKRLDLSFKAKFQQTFRTETYKSYAWNPKDYLRMKVGIDYKIKKTPFSPYLQAEMFYSLNNDEGNTIDNMRYTGGVTYKISKHHSIDVAFQIDNAMNVADPEDRYMLCAFYHYKF